MARNESEKLRDRICELDDEQRHELLDRLTWVFRQPSHIEEFNEAINVTERREGWVWS